MKYILLIMTMVQIKTFWGSIKGIFTPSKSSTRAINDLMTDLDKNTEHKELTDGLMLLFGILYGLFLSVYYIIAGVKVGSLIFAAVSCLMVIKSWRDVGKMIRWLDARDDELIRRRVKDRIWLILYLSYIGYLVYFLVVSW